MNEAARIAELETENATLRAEIERLRPPPRVIKVDGSFALPDLEQVEKLVRRVFEKYPNLRIDVDRGAIELPEFVAMVRASLAYIGTLHRMRSKTSKTRDHLSWMFEARDYLSRVGYPSTDIRGTAFLVGCIAAGDVCYSPARLYPQVEVGLLVGLTRDSYPASNKWLNLLAGGDFDSALVIEPAPLLHGAPRPPVNLAPGLDWRNQL